MMQDDVDAGRGEFLTTVEGKELIELRRGTRVLEAEDEIHKRASAYFAREVADLTLTDLIYRIHRDSRGNYGAKRVHDELSIEHGVRCNRKRVARLMRQTDFHDSCWRVASSANNALIESFWSTMQRELLDRRTWDSRVELAVAIFEWIQEFYDPRRRHPALTDHRGRPLSPAAFEALHARAEIAA